MKITNWTTKQITEWVTFGFTHDLVTLLGNGDLVTRIDMSAKLSHSNIVKGTFVSNVACIVNYEEGRIRIPRETPLNAFMAVNIQVSYSYEVDVVEKVTPLPLPG